MKKCDRFFLILVLWALSFFSHATVVTYRCPIQNTYCLLTDVSPTGQYFSWSASVGSCTSFGQGYTSSGSGQCITEAQYLAGVNKYKSGVNAYVSSCPTGTVADSNRLCQPDTRFTCWDGSKAASVISCPVDNRVTCWDGSKVAASIDSLNPNANCPVDNRVTCWDGSKVTPPIACPVTPVQITCADGSKVTPPIACPSLISTGSFGSGGGYAAGITAGQSAASSLLCGGQNNCSLTNCDKNPSTCLMTNFVVPTLSSYGVFNDSSAVCPTYTFHLEMMRMGAVTLNQHCVLLESVRGIISNVMRVCVYILFVLIILGA